ncbi:DUF4160 domain-containing protein [Acidithiobacillus ferriphilus]|nr:DUF4160 domain-containing protein [Acidithiobacillus ferriphilus]MEB8604368.1 DUF4160 domain-containing protein [Acidithiobacillus ferriphilus]
MTTYPLVDDWRVRINGREPHPLPHVHVQFRDGSRVSLAIETGELLPGFGTPRKRLVPVRAWIVARRETLLAEYRRLNP